MEFRILGPLEVRSEDGSACKFGSRKQRVLLAALLLNADQAVRAERLVEWLWGERPPESAMQNLYSYVSDLRKRLGGESASRLQTEATGYVLRVEPGELDAAAFEDLATQGRTDAEEGRYGPAAERFTRALGLWRADTVLDGLPLPDDLRTEAVRLEELRTTVVEDAFDARLALGRHREVVADLEAATRRAPLRERLWAQRMLALYRSGRQADALEAYQNIRKVLDAELGVEPGTELRQLQQQILNSDPALDLAGADGPPGSPESVSAVSAPAASTEAEPSADAPDLPPHLDRPAQLPADLATFSGRGEEVDRLLSLATQAGGAPMTVVVSAIDGMAGIGKTSLAVRVAHQVAERYDDGQVFLDLHGFTGGIPPLDPGDALDRLLRVLGVAGEQIPHNLDERAALWRTRLAGKKLLIVLDNAADETQVRPLLPGTPDCLVLVTSRRRLAGLDDAHPVSLDVLPLPDAVALLTRVAGERRLAGESAELLHDVVELCGRLPLALRVAASRLRHRPGWTLADLAERLRDQESRLAELEAGQRGVAVALDVSYAQLDAQHQRMYRLLGLHPGPDIEPYAAAALADTTARQAERLLDDLLDVHLLRQDQPGRYRFHDLIRAHADRCCALYEPEVRRQEALTHLFDHYAYTAMAAMDVAYPHESDQRPRLAQPTSPTPVLSHDRKAVHWLDAELANLLATAAYAEDSLPTHTVRMSSTLQWHLNARAYYAEAASLHKQAWANAHRVGDKSGEHMALRALGQVHFVRSHHEAAAGYYKRAAAIAREVNDRAAELDAVDRLGVIYFSEGSYGISLNCHRESVRIAREIGDRGGERHGWTGLGAVHLQQGRYELAVDCYAKAVGIAREMGDRPGEIHIVNGLSALYRRQGRYAEAVASFENTVELARAIGYRIGEIDALAGLGISQLLQKEADVATVTFEQVLVHARQMGSLNYEFEALHGLGHTRHAARDFVQALTFHERALDLAVEIGQPADQARARNGLGHVYRALGRYTQAGAHWRQALDLLAELDLNQVEEASVEDIRGYLAELDGFQVGLGG